MRSAFLGFVLLAACDLLNPKNEPVEVAPAKPAADKGDEKKGVDISPAPAPEDKWIEFSSQEGKFTAQFPSAPNKEVTQAPSPIGPIDSVIIAAQLGEAMFGVSYADYPDKILKDFKLDAGLDGARNGAINNIGGKLVKEEQITFAGQKARAFEATATAEGMNLRYESRLFFVSPRLYQLIVVSKAEDKVPSQKFFDSFELKK